MKTLELLSIDKVTIQVVGNKTLGDGISFADNTTDGSDIFLHIKALLSNTFNVQEEKRFDFVGSLDLNPVYKFSSAIFDDLELFVSQSQNLARYLYDQSLHPNIKSGDFFVIHGLFSVDNVNKDGLVFLKSENKEVLISTHNDGKNITATPVYGMSLKKLDKGCIVLNDCRDEGYRVLTIDKTNNGTDAHYWTESFLHVVGRDDDYHCTSQIADFCSCLVKKFKNEEGDLYSATKAKVASQLLSQSDIVTTEQIKTIFCDTEDASHKFDVFKAQFEETHGELPQEFTPCQAALKRTPVTKLNSVKLGKDFEVKVLNPEAVIERGYDEEKGMRYYKLYFNEEK